MCGYETNWRDGFSRQGKSAVAHNNKNDGIQWVVNHGHQRGLQMENGSSTFPVSKQV